MSGSPSPEESSADPTGREPPVPVSEHAPAPDEAPPEVDPNSIPAAATSAEQDELGAVDGATDSQPALARIESELARLTTLVDERLKYDAVKEEAFERLYRDLEQFRGEATAQQLRPVLLDLILLVDRVDAALADAETVRDTGPLLSSFRDELIEILERRGVMTLARADVTFDPQVQRAVEVQPAADRSDHNSVARVLRRGYVGDGKVLRPEDVVVRRFVGPAETDAR